MAPMTRMRADRGNVPNELMAEYYAQRAGAGLIVSEATSVAPNGHGGENTPGIYTQEQADGWRAITDVVHAEGGRIFLQLWHVGRQFAVSPVTTQNLTVEGIRQVIAEYREGARLALEAGFDGVEIHGANGYLPDQFLEDGTNLRTDEYGGPVENRARFLLEVTQAAIDIWGADRVGVRLSPGGTFGEMSDSAPWETFSYAVGGLNALGVAYVHLVEPRGRIDLSAARFRSLVTGDTKLITAGGYTRDSANRVISGGHADLVAFGRLFISNPDLPKRFELEAELNPYDRSTFYGGNARGYVDYPALALTA